MKALYSLVVFFFLTPYFLHAQSNYKPGYVVIANKDTLKGFVDYREWLRNPKEFNFKNSLKASSKKYTVAEAASFGIDNLEWYETATVQVSKSPLNFSVLPDHLDTAYTVDTVFLKKLATGKYISLYSYTDDIKTRYYLLDNASGQIQELKYYLYMDESMLEISGRYVKTVNSFYLQLIRSAITYQPDNKKLIDQIHKSAYSSSSLLDIFKVINGGDDRQTIKQSGFGIRFYGGTGISSSKLTFSTTQRYPFPDGTTANSTSPIISAGVDFLFNKTTRKLFFRLDLQYVSNHFNIPDTKIKTEAPTSSASLDFKKHTFSITPQFGYNFYSSNKLQFYLDAGFSVQLSGYNQHSYITTYSTGLVDTNNGYPEFRTFYFSLPLRAGAFICNHLEVYGTYSPSATITPYTGYGGNVTILQGGINYIW